MDKTTHYSNTISQQVMKLLDTDVFTATKERMRHVFETCDRVVVFCSGGKIPHAALRPPSRRQGSWVSCP